MDEIAFNADGLVPAIIQDDETGEVLMLAWMNQESLARTLETGRTWFWSRSRREFWCKGETSGDRQFVRSAHYDCDGDTLLFKVRQEGRGACHTGEYSCFFRSLAVETASGSGSGSGSGAGAGGSLDKGAGSGER